MKTAARGVRALVRSPLRSSLLVAVLAVSVGLTLIMITVNGAFSERLDEIKEQVGSDVTVRPAGSFGGGFFRGGFFGGGPPGQTAGGEDAGDSDAITGLANDEIDKILKRDSRRFVVKTGRAESTEGDSSRETAATEEPPPQKKSFLNRLFGA